MSNYIKQANSPRSSATFEFVSEFPKLHMPSLKVANADFTNPKKATCMQDGELVQVTANKTITKITTAAPPASFQQVYITHGKIGRSDIQAAGARPVIQSADFMFRTTLVEGVLAEGDFVAPTVLTTGDYAGTCGLGAATGEYVAVYLANEGNGWHLFRWQRGAITSAPTP